MWLARRLLHHLPPCRHYRRSFATGIVAAAAPPSKLKPNLLDLTYTQLQQQFAELGIPAYRTGQVFSHIYKRGARDLQSCTSLSLALRAELADRYRMDYGTDVKQTVSNDGTKKHLIEMRDGRRVECVYIAMKDRVAGSEMIESDSDSENNGSIGAVCLSSQVGCSLTCAFCATGHQPKSTLRNLTTSEIIGQLMTVLHATGDYQAALPSTVPGTLPMNRRSSGLVTSLVFMGSGEPLYNMKNLIPAIQIIQDHRGLAFGPRKITVSTSGVVPGIVKLREHVDVKLAISLHATNNSLRDELVPINRQFDLHSLLSACQHYQYRDAHGNPLSKARSQRNRLTFEYTMLKGVNDSHSAAQDLRRLIADYQLDVLVNLIPFNTWPGARFECSDRDTIERFSMEVRKSAPCTVRWPKGDDIAAACGTLVVEQLLTASTSNPRALLTNGSTNVSMTSMHG